MSVRRPAAIDRQRGAGDRRSALATKEGNSSRDLLDGHEALGRLLRQQDLANGLIAADAMRLRLAFYLALNEWRPYIARTYRIAGHAILGCFQCDHLGQADYAVLRRNI